MLKDCGCQAECKKHLIFKACAICWVTWTVKDRPLSLWRIMEGKNLGIFSLYKTLITSVALLVLHGKASIHSVKVSTNTSRNSQPFQGGICVKSSCQSSPGYIPWLWTGFKTGGGWGMDCTFWIYLCPNIWDWQTCFIITLKFTPSNIFLTKCFKVFLPKWVVWCKFCITFH